MSLGPTIEEFASKHQLPARRLELRQICNRLVARADFWYCPDLRNEARQLAVEASDILHLALAQRGRLALGQDFQKHSSGRQRGEQSGLVPE